MASRTTFQLLGSTEREIMEILWQHGPHTIPQIVKAIQQTRPTAHTTIKTTTEALLKKGFVTRHRQNRWAHTPTRRPAWGFDDRQCACGGVGAA
jgi:predicted transcriptional regulator